MLLIALTNMSQPKPDTGAKDLSPFQQFIKTNATGPEGAETATADPAPVPQETAELEPQAPVTEVAEEKQAPEPKSLGDLVRQRTQGTEAHEFFTDLIKPGKEASKGDQIKYVKEVGRRWEAHSKELEVKLKAQEDRTFDPTDTDEWKKSQEELEKYKGEAEAKGDLEQKLASVDLQYDPVFLREVTNPLAKEEQSLLDIVKVSKGEDANELIPILQAAVMAPTEAEFLNATREVAGQVDAHFAVAVFDHLKNIRSLNAKKTDYITNHQETADRFIAERQSGNKVNAEKFLKGNWKQFRETAQASVSSSWDMLDSLGNDELSKNARDMQVKAGKWADAGIRETIDTYGGVSDSIAQTVALAPELLSLVPLVEQAMTYMKESNAEHEKLKSEYEKLTQSTVTGTRTNRVAPPTQSDQPQSLVDFARSQGTI